MRTTVFRSSSLRAVPFFLLAACSASTESPGQGPQAIDEAAQAVVGAAPTASAATTTLSTVSVAASQDTSVRASAKNTNAGTATSLDVNRTLVAFDTAALRAQVGLTDVIVAARLDLTLTLNDLRKKAAPKTVSAYRLTQAWTETGATWNCAVDTNTSNGKVDCSAPNRWSFDLAPPNPWASNPTATSTIAPRQTGTTSFDVTADVQGFVAGSLPNDGWMILAPGSAEFAEFASRESATPPTLVLTIRRCSPSLCNDGNACTIDSCDAAANCRNVSVQDGTACADNNACTQTDTCQAGTCVGANPVSCNALDACHVVGTCDPATGACSNPEASPGTACNDANACTSGDSCQAGACVPGVARQCAARDACHQAGVCDPASGSCSDPAAPSGTPCEDGNVCTQGDQCFAGACLATSQVGCGLPPFVIINEVESSGGVPGDWVELLNTGSDPVDLSGWIFKDNDDTHRYALPAGTVLAPGATLVLDEASFGFGLGGADSARLYDASGVTLVDSYSWTAHATTTYGRCPNGTGAFTTTASSTKGLVNDCGSPGGADAGADGSPDSSVSDGGTDSSIDVGDGGSDASQASDGASLTQVVINEVESSGGVPGDWAELYNPTAASVDLSGYVFRDNDNTHTYVLPSGSVVAAGSYLVLDEASFGFGLGSGDSARLFDPSGALVDTYTWTAHASTTYGRCPNGVGSFATTASATKGAANDCGALASDGGLDSGPDAGGDAGSPYSAWPGSDPIVTVDPAGAYASNLSGLSYQPATASVPAVLWAVQNGPSTLYRLEWDGSNWVSSTTNGWNAGKTLSYTDGTGGPDSEGVTRAEDGSSALYVSTERDNTHNTVSRLSVLRFDGEASGTSLVATHDWNLTADLPSVGPNLGLEGITWIPDTYLVARGFVDQSTSALYDPANYPGHGTGIFLVGVEATGMTYAYVLDHNSGSFHRLADVPSGHIAVMDLSFDRDAGQLWTYCDDTCGNKATVLSVGTDPALPTFGRFYVRASYDHPAQLPNANNEGFAVAPESECVSNLKSVFWADDSATSGHSIRRGSVRCGTLP